MSRISRVALTLLLIAGTAIAGHAQTTVKPMTRSKAECDKMMANMDHAAMGQKGDTGKMDHMAMMKACPMAMPAGEKMAMPMGGKMAMAPSMPGQAAFGAIGEIVRQLESDPATDWSKVNLEALRQHLIDMDAVTLRSRIAQHPVPGGFAASVTGDAATAAAIRRMLPMHAMTFDTASGFEVTTTSIPSGIGLTVVARSPTDSAMVARIRGLGVIGFLTEGDHHAGHHLAIARGDAMAHMH